MPEIVLGSGIFCVFQQFRQQRVRVEDVDAHRGIDHVRHERRAEAGVLRLLLETAHLAVLCHLYDAELIHILWPDGQGRQRHLGVRVHVLLQHAGVVHLVDVIAGEDDHVLRLFRADGVDVLVHGVRRTLVPALGDALHGRQDFDKFSELIGDDRPPALADVPVERQCLVLGQDVHVAQVGVDAVGKRDVDDAVLTGERHGRLGAVAGERKQALSGTAGEQDTEGISHGDFLGKASATNNFRSMQKTYSRKRVPSLTCHDYNPHLPQERLKGAGTKRRARTLVQALPSFVKLFTDSFRCLRRAG